MSEGIIAYIIIILVIKWVLKRLGVIIRLNMIAGASLLFFAIISFFTAVLFMNRIPQVTYAVGNSYPVIPIFTAILLTVLGLMSFKIKASSAEILTEGKGAHFAFLFEIIGILFWTLAYYSFLVSIYSPALFHAGGPVPRYGTGLYLIGSCIVPCTLLLAARFARGTSKSISLVWVSFFVALYSLFVTTLFSLQLVYGMPKNLETIYPFLASVLPLAYIPYSIMMFVLAKNNA